ncbi:hypothetical protein HMPREF9318_01691 [Streptococcus urinalis FB127-CNA-2]|uniref:Uncharacterized protein n=1 Tax=Streptococcus urinalis 2285-97 TaxID=764291 RepID=G5KET2_9STRE|nr:hypothetical protein [Streptococcus urinalis]EHJ56197.1 hypothetical protein STRUR_2141 [Streptococcus urinalis 2285-97]EKS18192.1 hypothetical protein HMPREF9318_01691 [Streptococcus urinalis FB127-CNA-2]VEF32983.1 Uncharacterised protein [Streptococcus urinalis]
MNQNKPTQMEKVFQAINSVNHNTYIEDIMITDEIHFSSNRWDFRNYNLDGNIITDKPYQRLYNFSDLQSKQFKYLLKIIILKDKFVKNNTFSTTWSHYYLIKKFLLYLEDKQTIYNLEFISSKVLNNYLELYKDKSIDYKMRTAHFLNFGNYIPVYTKHKIWYL